MVTMVPRAGERPVGSSNGAPGTGSRRALRRGPSRLRNPDMYWGVSHMWVACLETTAFVVGDGFSSVGILFYILVYTFMNIGAFAVVGALERQGATASDEPEDAVVDMPTIAMIAGTSPTSPSA